VRNELGRLGVHLIDGESVSEALPTQVITRTGRSIAYDICIWSAGMRASPIAQGAGLATDKQGRCGNGVCRNRFL
jgi:NADH dehydrogenase FAD-containing subunit